MENVKEKGLDFIFVFLLDKSKYFTLARFMLIGSGRNRNEYNSLYHYNPFSSRVGGSATTNQKTKVNTAQKQIRLAKALRALNPGELSDTLDRFILRLLKYVRLNPGEEVLRQFKAEKQVKLHRRNGWINPEETTKIGHYFYSGIPVRQIAIKFACTEPTVHAHAVKSLR